MTQKPETPEEKRNKLRKKWYGKAVLFSASLLYGAGASLREKLYKSGKLKTEKLDIPVICVGNLSTGGTGKTPAIITLCTMLLQEGIKPAVLTRGYNRKKNRNSVTVIAEGDNPPKEECGDEPLMIARELGHKVPVLISPNRYASGTVAAFQYGADLAIMDDGFQHFQLKRDINIVLVNAAQPFTKDHLLPYGNLRETPKGLERATVVLLTHCELVDRKEIDNLREAVREYTYAPVLESSHKPMSFLKADTEEDYDIGFFNGRDAVALSGIGNPESFEGNLTQLGINIRQTWRYPDHHNYTEDELMSARNAAGKAPIITTFKDFSRFPENWKELMGTDVYLLKIALDMDDTDRKSILRLMLTLKIKK